MECCPNEKYESPRFVACRTVLMTVTGTPRPTNGGETNDSFPPPAPILVVPANGRNGAWAVRSISARPTRASSRCGGCCVKRSTRYVRVALRVRFAGDSPQEGDGFEPSVPHKKTTLFGCLRSVSQFAFRNKNRLFRAGTEGSNPSPSSRRNPEHQFDLAYVGGKAGASTHIMNITRARRMPKRAALQSRQPERDESVGSSRAGRAPRGARTTPNDPFSLSRPPAHVARPFLAGSPLTD